MLAALVAIAAGVAMLALFSNSSPHAPLPNPNGYDDFLKAASLLGGDPGSYETLGRDELRALVATNAEVLRVLRLGLTRQCSVPTEEMITNYAVRISDLPKLKSLRHLLAAEGRLAEMEERPADAARSYVGLIQMGNEIGRGGLMINYLFSISFAVLGDNSLVQLVPKLDCEQMRPVRSALEKVDSTQVAWEQVVQDEGRFCLHELRKTLNPLQYATSWWQNRTSRKIWLQRRNNITARLRLLMAELALRCYRSEEGHPPTALDQLVPRDLQRVPIDPFSGRPLIYQQRGTNWLLYSVGVDGVDDGGKPVGPSISGIITKGDLFFDSPK